MQDLTRYLKVMGLLYDGAPEEPKLLQRARALDRVVRGEPLEQVAQQTKLSRFHLSNWTDSIQQGGLYEWLDASEPTQDALARARQGIVQMLLGSLAETHFEELSRDVLGAQGFGVEDERVGRTDTDYRLIDAEGRPICRLNIKFHGTLFRESAQYVGLEPEDCFALATYKIHGALRRQDEERVPYVFLIISVPDIRRAEIEPLVSNDFAWLAAISSRAVEEAIVRSLLSEGWVEPLRSQVRGSHFRVISARRAHHLLRDLLFERVHALRLRGFNRTFRGAEINMHLSLSREMIPYQDFLTAIAERGPLQVAVRLERGEI
ncbi:MAG: hypothetical protein KGN76_02715 [Acidobacteriota bacterium]|nr:hypothetical protein [Acidobacteriota bacterium]